MNKKTCHTKNKVKLNGHKEIISIASDVEMNNDNYTRHNGDSFD